MGAFAEEPARGGLLRRLFDALFERVPPLDPEAADGPSSCRLGPGGCRGNGYGSFATDWIVERVQARGEQAGGQTGMRPPT